jgi:hypothetical protein
MNSKLYIGIHGYVIVYSVASRQSFEMVRIIRDKLLNHLVSPLTYLMRRPLDLADRHILGRRIGSYHGCWKQERRRSTKVTKSLCGRRSKAGTRVEVRVGRNKCAQQ